ncbi:MAG: enoyl-CoA hydratase-related protein [Gammaproteobacteria bacterium]|jgi:crotonobetainyl-CoA hydratase|nr:enoyl-CoA hydratase-related protein [Gammaproteobacteria bacterium]
MNNTTTHRHIEVSCADRIMTITINRPEVMNALNPATHAEMSAAFDQFERDDALWVAILTGAGEAAFCAGGDISAMVDAETEEDYQVPGTGYGGLTHRWSCDKPIIAAVNGLALGGGFELALSADLVVAADSALFGLPEPKIGTAAVASGMHRLVRDIGLKPAMEILLTAEFIDARRAHELGLVNAVVAPADVMSTAREYAAKILKCAPLAVRATKHCALAGRQYPSAQEAMEAQLAGRFGPLEAMYQSQDIREGLQAFMDKRKPQWQAR